jgi:nicotinamide phosphoribosyltransferase
MKFAIKCSYVEISGQGGRAVAKDPATDKSKRNKPGRLKLIKTDNGQYTTVNHIEHAQAYEQGDDQLITVFENGQLIHEYSLETIRKRCQIDVDQIDAMITL